jgi:hypothetical protein
LKNKRELAILFSIMQNYKFDNIIPTNRLPRELGDYDYIVDISSCIFYDSSNNIIYDVSNNITFYNHNYYINYFVMCINYVSIVTEKNNYLYLFLIDDNNSTPLCKIGYSCYMPDRHFQLKNKLKVDLLLLAVIPINGEFEEKELHKYLKLKCPYCIMNYIYPDKTKATEIYKIHLNLISELYYYTKNIIKINEQKLEIIKEETKQIEYQEKTKQIEYQETTKQIEYQEKTKQIEYQEKTKQEQEKTEQLRLELEILKLKLKLLNINI